MTPSEEILAALGSASRIRILFALGRRAEEWLPKYQIQKATSIRPTLLRDTLLHLAECGWVEVQGIEGANRFRMKLSNPRTASFLRFLSENDCFSE